MSEPLSALAQLEQLEKQSGGLVVTEGLRALTAIKDFADRFVAEFGMFGFEIDPTGFELGVSEAGRLLEYDLTDLWMKAIPDDCPLENEIGELRLGTMRAAYVFGIAVGRAMGGGR